MSVREICDVFEAAHLARPNSTVLGRSLSSDRRVSSRRGTIRALKAADDFFIEQFPDLIVTVPVSAASLNADVSVNLRRTPLIDESFVHDLENMMELYATLHILENSMRRLIENVLEKKLGTDWWEKSSSAPQRKKHEDRLAKEKTRKWLPARSNLGPLYSLDWSDLISIMRKYETDFVPYLGEIDFLHRFADLGLVRHVVAHHGFIDDPRDYDRVKIALHDWQKQVRPAIAKS